jgi:hypothetical protein
MSLGNWLGKGAVRWDGSPRCRSGEKRSLAWLERQRGQVMPWTVGLSMCATARPGMGNCLSAVRLPQVRNPPGSGGAGRRAACAAEWAQRTLPSAGRNPPLATARFAVARDRWQGRHRHDRPRCATVASVGKGSRNRACALPCRCLIVSGIGAWGIVLRVLSRRFSWHRP